MRDTIKVRQDDILWRFYCKRFSVEGKEIESPKNLCRYFWTSVEGFGLWLGREVRLKSLWLIGLVAVVSSIAVAKALPTSTNYVVVVAIMVLLGFFFMAIIVTLIHALRVVEAQAPWVVSLAGFCAIALVIASAFMPGIFWPEFERLLRWIRYGLIVIVVIVIIDLVLRIIIPHDHLQKLQRLFQTLGAFVNAKKDRVCPPVIPPEGFKTKQ